RYPVCLSRVKGQKEKEGDMKTPSCTIDNPFTITEIKDASTWTHDFGDGRGAILSYGHWFMRLATPHKGIGIHGNTGNEDKMPGRDSEGCIRLTDAGIDHFKQHYAKKGMKVIIKAENQGRYPFETPAIKSPGKPIAETETKGA
ncbi:MAG: L,D-transpeptidase, partial [Bacteroidales bacterium]|nr:L,D-transpeptidase [Bacteroidales bacterium]